VKLVGVKPGNLVVLLVAWGQQTNGNVPTVSGWSIAENPAGQVILAVAWEGATIFYREGVFESVQTANIIPGASSTSCGMTAVMVEYDNIATASALDAHTNNSSASASNLDSGTTGATTVATETVVALVSLVDALGVTHADNGISTPATVGYTSIAVNQDNIAYTACEDSYKAVAATGTQIANWTVAAASCYQAAIATFKGAPRIDTQPVTQWGAVGGTVTFTITATTSVGTLHYQWKDDGSNVGSDSSSYTTAALVIGDDTSIIICVVTDDNGTATSFNAYLRVAQSSLISWTTV
jgi:hypothetical protein